MSVSLSAVILAAGRSSRMGADKALLATKDGKKLWSRQRDLLVRAGATEIFISARPEQTWAQSGGEIRAVLRDAKPDQGPLAGITRALESMRSTHLAVLAVDLPMMEAEWFKQLAKRCEPGRGVVGKREDFFEPLAAIYPVELASLAVAALARGELALQRFVAAAIASGSMRERTITPMELPWFENWNERTKSTGAGNQE